MSFLHTIRVIFPFSLIFFTLSLFFSSISFCYAKDAVISVYIKQDKQQESHITCDKFPYLLDKGDTVRLKVFNLTNQEQIIRFHVNYFHTDRINPHFSILNIPSSLINTESITFLPKEKIQSGFEPQVVFDIKKNYTPINTLCSHWSTPYGVIIVE